MLSGRSARWDEAEESRGGGPANGTKCHQANNHRTHFHNEGNATPVRAFFGPFFMVMNRYTPEFRKPFLVGATSTIVVSSHYCVSHLLQAPPSLAFGIHLKSQPSHQRLPFGRDPESIIQSFLPARNIPVISRRCVIMRFEHRAHLQLHHEATPTREPPSKSSAFAAPPAPSTCATIRPSRSVEPDTEIIHQAG